MGCAKHDVKSGGVAAAVAAMSTSSVPCDLHSCSVNESGNGGEGGARYGHTVSFTKSMEGIMKRTNAKSLTELQKLFSFPKLMRIVATNFCFSVRFTCSYAGCMRAPVSKASIAAPCGD